MLINISVREMVELILRSGDISSEFTCGASLLEGLRTHQWIQKNSGENYKPEVNLKYDYIIDEENTVCVQGRADGIIENETITIDEIKTIAFSIEDLYDTNVLHWSQAKCYAYMYCKLNNLDLINVQLTYCEFESRAIKRFLREFTIADLEEFFSDLVNKYFNFIKPILDWEMQRNESLSILNFPYVEFRDGQRKLSVMVYKSIIDGKILFAQAPTGIGKTIGVVFPALKVMGKGNLSKIFYLTAKNTGCSTAEIAMETVRKNGGKIKTITVTAKEKICFLDEPRCNPKSCEYALGHFDRVNEVIKELFRETDYISKEVIKDYALRYKVCPFELSLDMANFTDCIICDYNYAFDPNAYLKRFFEEGKNTYCLLVDEAHNLVDRGRDMFSSEICKSEVMEVKHAFIKKKGKIYKGLDSVNKYMIKLKKVFSENDENILIQNNVNSELLESIRKFMESVEKNINFEDNEETKEKIVNFYFKCKQFSKIAEMFDENYLAIIKNFKDDILVNLNCIDPSKFLRETMDKVGSSILFSATLTPFEYFINILGGDENSIKLRLPSPFPKENLCLMVRDNVSTKYKNRESTYNEIVNSIKAFVDSKVGNYMIFFPSYIYMKEVYARFKNICSYDTSIQEEIMKEEDRVSFISKFKVETHKTFIGFAVLGGIFGEGIDLKGDRLSGTVIVGVGLPKICTERDIIKDFNEHKYNKGFEYAYMYPGMNKVLQAAGRVIRTEKDIGAILLIDDRFIKRYMNLFPDEWFPIINVKSSTGIEEVLKKFWNR